MQTLPTLISKALTDTGYDLLQPAADGWVLASVSGSPAKVAVRMQDAKILLAVPESGIMARIDLASVECSLPPEMASAGQAGNAEQLYQALRVLHSLQIRPATVLSAELEARLEAIPATERTREVRQRIGQDIFREALLDLWQGRCALSGVELPPELLRASHAKPWALASDEERLEPFNGLLLAVHYDALFDRGLIAFNDNGGVMISPLLTSEARQLLNLDDSVRLRFVLPGHREYLRYHRNYVAG